LKEKLQKKIIAKKIAPFAFSKIALQSQIMCTNESKKTLKKDKIKR